MSDLPHRPIAPGVCVAPQLAPESMAEAARLGFKSVVNNRPDVEYGPDQPRNSDIEAAAAAAGLQYRFMPVAPGHQTPEEAAACARMMAELPHPVLMFCRTGTRSANLYRLAQHVTGGAPG